MNGGDRIVVENPTYLGAVQAFHQYQVEFVTVPMDDHGMRTDLLEDALRSGAKFVYVLPNFYNPAGVTLPLERREKLVELAGHYGVPIVEDDPYGQLRYTGNHIPLILVLFPRTWERTREMLTVGQIVIVEGKVDTNSAPPKILVDTVRTEIKILEPLSASHQTPPKPAPNLEALSQPKPFDKAQDKPDSHVKNLHIKSTQPKPIVPPQPKPVMPQPVMQAAEKKEPYSVGRDAIPPYDDLNGMPPPPDNFPDDWDTQWQPSFEDVALASKPEPKFKKTEVVTPPRVQLEKLWGQVLFRLSTVDTGKAYACMLLR